MHDTSTHSSTKGGILHMQLTQANREYNTCAEHSSRPFQNQTAGGGAGPETSSSFAEKWL